MQFFRYKIAVEIYHPFFSLFLLVIDCLGVFCCWYYFGERVKVEIRKQLYLTLIQSYYCDYQYDCVSQAKHLRACYYAAIVLAWVFKHRNSYPQSVETVSLIWRIVNQGK